jgi:hypothetical protein
VQAPAAMTADALTKCLLLAPAPLGARLLEEFGAASLQDRCGTAADVRRNRFLRFLPN